MAAAAPVFGDVEEQKLQVVALGDRRVLINASETCVRYMYIMCIGTTCTCTCMREPERNWQKIRSEDGGTDGLIERQWTVSKLVAVASWSSTILR